MGDWVLAVEGALWLGLAGLAVRTLSFARLARIASGPWRRDGVSPAPAAAAIGRAVDAAARRAPWPVRCFEKALAAHAMLRRRGAASVLYYGGRNDASRGLTAHAWVRLGGANVVGGDSAGDFAVLAAFPPAEPAPPRAWTARAGT
ncbi:MAG TPA: lasso peptide biosynthesis B2 protein [Caulobacteraceae bacterium]|nr:lasso peptide biosynthesis B2 protein [Caulobacteraceae bacterium]